MVRKINLGCEYDILKGYENYDIKPANSKVNFLDLNLKIPMKKNSVDEILISHVLEHIENPTNVLKELHRICKPKGIINMFVPHFSHFTNYADLTHNKSFSYFSLGSDFTNKSLYPLFNVTKTLNFNRINYKWLNVIFNPIINMFPLIYERFFCYILPCSEIHFKLEVKKTNKITDEIFGEIK